MQQFSVRPVPEAVRVQADAWRKSGRAAEAARVLEMAAHPVGIWLGDWTKDPEAAAASAVAVPGITVLVAYNIMRRDGGSYSAGGAASAKLYEQWIAKVAAGIRRGPGAAVVVLEPDATAFVSYLSKAEQGERDRALSGAVHVLRSAGAEVFVDAGPSPFPEGDDRSWGNWTGARVGAAPSADLRCEGYRLRAWVKPPWESDGAFAGAPAAGKFWPEAAIALSR